MKCLYVILLLCCTEVAKAVVPKVVAPLNPVLGVAGDDLILPCYLENNVSAVDMDVQWIIEGRLVHHYKNLIDQTANLLPQYHNRTSLFKDELQRGNISLRLSSVRLSDSNTYTCYVRTGGGPADAYFKVQVNELGNEPEVSAKSHNNGSVTLTCTSTNWTVQPVIEWLDNKGKALPNTKDLDYCQSHDTTRYVQGHLTVMESDGYEYTCKVSYLNQGKKKAFHVERKLFGQPRHYWIDISLFIVVPVIIIVLTAVIMWCRSKKRRALQYKTFIKTSKGDWKVELEHFTTPMIIHGHRKIDISKEASMQCRKDYQIISVEQLLSHKDHCSVILQGESGLGKSCTLKWIMQEWTSGKSYLDHFDLVFLLECDEMTLSSQRRNLLDLVNNDPRYEDLISETLKESPHRVLFLIDGFNEFTFSQEETKSSPADLFTRAQTKSILSGLLSGRVLPESSLLVTTRPSASDRLTNLLKERPKRFAEILGFTEEGVENYFSKFFRGKENPFPSFKKNDMLFTSCSRPFFCWLFCQACMRKTQKKVELGTVTSIFLNYLAILLPHQQSTDGNILSQLCDHAKTVMQEGKNQFEWNSTQLWKGTGILRSINTGQQKRYSFIHQSFVEYIAALRYAIIKNEESQREEVEDLLMSAQNDFLHSKPRLQPVLKFLFGLSNEGVRSFLQKTYGLPDSSTSDHPGSFPLQIQLKQWILSRLDILSNKQAVFLLHCLHELHDEQFVKEVMERLESISFLYKPLTHTDCLVIQYCFKLCPRVKQLDLRHCNLTAEKLKFLQPVWAELQYDKLWLTAEGLENTDIEEFLTSPGKGLLSSSEENKRTMNLQFSSMKHIPLKIVSYLLNMHQRANNLSLSLEMDTAGADSFCSSFSAERDGLLFILTFGYHKAKPINTQQAGPEVRLISLTLPTPEATRKSASDPISYRSSEDWNQFLQNVEKLSLFREEDSLLAEHLNSLPDLKKLEIEVNYLTEAWASKTVHCMHTCPTLLDLKVFVGDQEESRKTSQFSSVTLRRVTISTFCLETGDFSSDEATVSLILPTSAVSSQEKSADLLQNIIRLRDVTDQELEKMDECVQALLSIPGVEKVKLRMSAIPVDLAKMVVSFCCNHQKIFVSLETPAKRVVGSVCSSLCVGKDGGNLQLSVMDGRISSSSYTTPVLSGIILQSESDPISPLEMDWKQFFTKFHSLRGTSGSSAEADHHVGAFLLSLTGLHGLKKVNLFMSSLSDALKNTCSTLQEARVSCGRNALVGDNIIWVGDDEPEKGRFAFTFTVKRPLPHSSEVTEARQTSRTQVNLMQCRHSYCQI